MKRTQPHGLDCVYIGRYHYRRWHWDECRWDYIVHLANISPRRILSVAGPARILYCSSGGVYHEEYTQYDQDKHDWECLCLDSGLDVVIARLFSFFNAPGHACAEFIREARKGWPVRIWGDGNAVRSYMHGRDLGKWMWAILFKGKMGEAYDVGSDVPVTMLELARMVTNQWKAPILICNSGDRVPYYMPFDTAKTRALL